MTYTLKDIKHLEVMANLLNAEPAAPKEINIKELLKSDVVHEPTTDEKILSLCSKLRNEGFDKQANSLEQKFLNYKSATTHMYRAIDEDGEDLINAAHPEGEVKVEDAEGDLGHVETILTEHKKIVDKINKTPTGKLASYVGQIKQILQKEAVLPLVVWIWSKTNRINQGIEKNTDILLSELVDIENSKEIKRSAQAIAYVEAVKTHLNELKQFTTTYRKIITPRERDMGFINSYGKFIVDVIEPELKQLDGVLRRIRSEDESTILPSVYRTFIASDFEDVQKAIRGLWGELLAMTRSISDAKKEYAAAKQREEMPPTDPTLSEYNPNAPDEESVDSTRSPVFERGNLTGVQEELNKLNNWKSILNKKQIDATNKTHINTWLDSQIQELKAAKTQDQINKIISENKDFESQGLI